MVSFMRFLLAAIVPFIIALIYLRASRESLAAFEFTKTADKTDPPPRSKLFALADIHGDFPRALSVLQVAGVVDENGHWAANSSTLVQTGDIVDRGPDTQKIYAWTRNLTREAEKQGGRVVKLWGNHEYMNVRPLLLASRLTLVGDGDLDARRSERHSKLPTAIRGESESGLLSRWLHRFGLDDRLRSHVSRSEVQSTLCTRRT